MKPSLFKQIELNVSSVTSVKLVTGTARDAERGWIGDRNLAFLNKSQQLNIVRKGSR